MNADLLLDYVRLISYGIVVVSSLRGIFSRSFSNILFVGDILLALALIALRTCFFFSCNMGDANDLFLTPTVVLWAAIHYHTMIRDANGVGK